MSWPSLSTLIQMLLNLIFPLLAAAIPTEESSDKALSERAWGIPLGIAQEYCGCWSDPYVRRDVTGCASYCIYASPRGKGLFYSYKGLFFNGCDCYDETLAAPRIQNGLRKDGLYNSACDCNGYRLRKDGFPDNNSTSWAVYKPTCDQINYVY
jgi:hypothetical protein